LLSAVLSKAVADGKRRRARARSVTEKADFDDPKAPEGR
jgi:hypothetical protein